MTEFLIQTLFMFLGALLPILFRSVNYARTKFDLWFFIKDNQYRFYIAGVICLVISTLLSLEGKGIIEALKTFGVIVPVVSASVVGFGVSAFVMIKTPAGER